MSSATLDSSLIWTDVCAKDKLDALRQMSARLCDRGIITDSDIFLEDVLERELAGATGIGGASRSPMASPTSSATTELPSAYYGTPSTGRPLMESPSRSSCSLL